MTIKTEFDVVVIGGGPAGILAAKHAAMAGKAVCLFDRKKNPGYPVRCGEAIGLKGFTSSVSLKKEWIKSSIKSMKLVSPSGIEVLVPNNYEGYIVDRVLMEEDITKDAVAAGVTFFPGTTIMEVKKNGLQYSCIAKDITVFSPCVILAEGIESRLARSLGWKTDLVLGDIETCAFARVSHKDIEPEVCAFHLGTNVSPGGYVWVFHRGGTTANIGLGVLGSRSQPGLPKKLLMDFINKHYPGAEISEVHCGGVPMGKWIKPLVRDGVMLVGDAGHLVNCISGAGIAYSLFSGRVAGAVAGKAVADGICDCEMLKDYEKEWASFYGKQQMRSFSLKEVMIGFTDAFLDDVAKSIIKSGTKNLSVLKIFIKAFSKHPLMLFKVIRLLK